MRRALALLLGLILTLPAGGATAARLGYARTYCLSETIAPIDAISSCTAVLQKFHKQAAVFIRRGAAFAELGAFDYAVGDFSRAINLSPGDGLALELRGLAYELQGRLAESLADYQRAQASGRADSAVAAAISRVTQAMLPTPAPAAIGPLAEDAPAPPRAALATVTARPEVPARAADGWFVAASMIFASAALALRLGRRREDSLPA
jgi:tetratricopeptide (TPR) repeat protein